MTGGNNNGAEVYRHEHWSSRFVFILAATGSAVGLGNIWKFPYVTGENGGGAFVLVYLLCVAVIGAPVMMAEVLIGRRGQQSPIRSMRIVAGREGASSWLTNFPEIKIKFSPWDVLLNFAPMILNIGYGFFRHWVIRVFRKTAQ